MEHEEIDRSDRGDGVEQLLRAVGSRDEPSPEFAREVRAAVHAEWLATVRLRGKRKTQSRAALAAGIATIALGVVLIGNFSLRGSSTLEVVASIAKLQHGGKSGVAQVSVDKGTWRDIATGERLAAGAVVRTDSATSVAFDFGKGLSVRLDRASQLKLVAPDRVALEEGRIYVDAQTDGPHRTLLVQTAFGTIEHVGTQYQAHVTQDALDVSVREGRIALTHARFHTQADAGERVEVGSGREMSRTSISPHGADWQWAADAAPSFVIENQSLAAFLQWAGRETGRAVRYASADVRADAERVVLRGSIADLTPDQAIAAVLATTEFVHTLNHDSINVSRK